MKNKLTVKEICDLFGFCSTKGANVDYATFGRDLKGAYEEVLLFDAVNAAVPRQRYDDVWIKSLEKFLKKNKIPYQEILTGIEINLFRWGWKERGQ